MGSMVKCVNTITHRGSSVINVYDIEKGDSDFVWDNAMHIKTSEMGERVNLVEVGGRGRRKKRAYVQVV